MDILLILPWTLAIVSAVGYVGLLLWGRRELRRVRAERLEALWETVEAEPEPPVNPREVDINLERVGRKPAPIKGLNWPEYKKMLTAIEEGTTTK